MPPKPRTPEYWNDWYANQAEALAQAREQAARLGVTDARFQVGDLTASGIEVRERPSWLEFERDVWQEAVTIDPGQDPALISFHDEGVRSLELFTLIRRVLAVATVPVR